MEQVQLLFVTATSDTDPAYIDLRHRSLAHLTALDTWIPHLRGLSRKIRNLRSGAQPGPSKTRNTHLKVCMRTRWGPPTLLAWVQLWCNGSVPPRMATPLLSGWIAPLLKPNGKGVRPIALFECGVKLSTGLLLDAITRKVSTIVGPYQFGIGMPAGAEIMLASLQALSRSSPHLVFVGTDIKNAFGSAFRDSTLSVCDDLLPPLSPALSQLWASGPTTMFAQDSPTSWKIFLVRDGVFQGECLSTAAFCLLMHAVILDFYQSIDAAVRNSVFVFAYIDDVVLVMPPQLLATLRPIWDACLRKKGLP